MARPRKPKRVKLTSYELILLENPPTQGTWICPHDDFPNSQSSSKCWLCQTNRPSKAKLVWPAYVAACEKLQLTPGLGRWKQLNAEEAVFYDKDKGKWIEAEVPYEGEPSLVHKNLVSEEVPDKSVVT